MSQVEDILNTVHRVEEQMFGQVPRRTIARLGDEALEQYEHLQNIIEILSALSNTDSEDFLNSLVAFRLVELFWSGGWLAHTILHGAYHSAIRDMRYHLEAMVHAYVIDQEQPAAEMEAKTDLIEELDKPKNRGFRSLLDRSDLHTQDHIYELYKDLCKYVHPSVQELEPALIEGKVGPRLAYDFDPERFELARSPGRRTADVLVFVVVQRFPWAIQAFRDRAHIRKSLEVMEQDLTLGLVEPRS